MKSLQDLQQLLSIELHNSIVKMASKPKIQNYNEILGDTSFILSNVLGQLLKKDNVNWIEGKWIDDSILGNVILINHKVIIWGLMIWGKDNGTKQWVSPFRSDVLLDENKKIIKLDFLFLDADLPDITYEKFTKNRGIWEDEFLLYHKWDAKGRNWKYIFSI